MPIQSLDINWVLGMDRGFPLTGFHNHRADIKQQVVSSSVEKKIRKRHQEI